MLRASWGWIDRAPRQLLNPLLRVSPAYSMGRNTHRQNMYVCYIHTYISGHPIIHRAGRWDLQVHFHDPSERCNPPGSSCCDPHPPIPQSTLKYIYISTDDRSSPRQLDRRSPRSDRLAGITGRDDRWICGYGPRIVHTTNILPPGSD